MTKLATTNRSCVSIRITKFFNQERERGQPYKKFSFHLTWSPSKIWLLFVL